MKSILQVDEEKCYLCGMPENGDHLDWHHVFEGSRRQLSEKYGLKVKLHHRQCHQEGPRAVHRNAETMKRMKATCQKAAMDYYGWSVEEWIKIFGKSYL
jgi:hypothetical protein